MAGARMTSFFSSCIFVGVAIAVQQSEKAGPAFRSQGGAGRASTILLAQRDVQAEQTLMICNAYTSNKALDVFIVQNQQKLTANGSLAYKACNDFAVPLQEGDSLDFKAGDMSVGTFKATGLPKTSSSLLLVPYRKNAETMKASFESHAFSNLQTSQIVVVDTFLGSEVGKVKIMDLPELIDATKKDAAPPPPPRVEALRFNSVVALNPGKYEVMLEDSADRQVSSQHFQVDQSHTKYVVMRVGSAGSQGDTKASFPQELVVFPQLSGSLVTHLNIVAVLTASLVGLAHVM